MENNDIDMAGTENNEELDDMKRRLKEMEDEAAALREMQAKVEKEMGSVQDPATAAASQANREEVDSRSVFVGNVDYSCTPEEVQQHFQSCGTVNRVTIRTDKFGQPKGYAYVEFLEVEAVQEALLLNESELHGRQLKCGSSSGDNVILAFWFFNHKLIAGNRQTDQCTWNEAVSSSPSQSFYGFQIQNSICCSFCLFSIWIWKDSKVQNANALQPLLLNVQIFLLL
ncbi:polyadenylate-binding protein 2-like [Quillaja saponaria]|uniref:Polyadenylate-binding protein 2-like n=1 Tax=Quillaja saponaria TaxID=32244 RepID=A0AAD7M1J0_QUISA|nr:polyadenylate-binding protein 2-like [Quillaja saponaria]